MLEKDSFSTHTIRVDSNRNEYNVEPHQIRLNDKPDGVGGVHQTKIPYCFTAPIGKTTNRWEVSFMHPGSTKQWTESHCIIGGFFPLLDDPQVRDQEVGPLVKAILSLLFTPESLDNLDVEDFVIALPEGCNIARFDELKRECAEQLPRKVQHKAHLKELLTEKCRYAKVPADPSPLFSLLRSVDGLPSADQHFVFFEDSGCHRVGCLKEGRFVETFCKSDRDINPSATYAVGIVDGGKIMHALGEEGYYNFRDMDEALYKAKTLAILQESALEVYRIAEMRETLSNLRAEAATLTQKLEAQKGTLLRLNTIRKLLRWEKPSQPVALR
ncbi:hypothetical protein [Pelobacter propionicus]|nr:hypothetical protein [Pelobacter propionicus]